jgi:ADP-ribosylglycohydrolase
MIMKTPSRARGETPSRARGALYGLAIGDALGMPTQMLSRPEIVARWGAVLTGFEPAPPGHPIAAGLPAGTVTDDTEQAVLLGRLLVQGHGTIDPRDLAVALVRWERDMAERGSLDLLGPSTKRAVSAVLEGIPPEEAGATGATNGAAMRIAPVGIAVPLDLPNPATTSPPLNTATHPPPSNTATHPPPSNTAITSPPAGTATHPHPATTPDDPCLRANLSLRVNLSTLVDQVEVASRVTHNTGTALAGAAAVAAAVSAGVSGAGIEGAMDVAVRAARIGAERGHWVAGADVAARIEWAVGLVAARDQAEAAELIYTLVGTSLATQESVPAAFAVLAVAPDDPWQACLLAASLGGDCDTIAAMAGAIAGACAGVEAFPPEALAVIDAQDLGLTALADDLYALRSRPANRSESSR